MKLTTLIRALSLCTIAGLPLMAHAQINTLRDAAQQAIATNPDVLARVHAVEAAKFERNVSAGGFLPRLDLSANAGRETLHDPQINQTYSRSAAALTLTQLLYDGLATSNDVKRLEFAQAVRAYELNDTFETVALEVARAYFDVLRYRRLVTLAEDNYVQHRAVFEQIQRKTDAGVGRRVDLEQAAGRLALAEANLTTDISNLHDVSARFQRLVGAAPAADLQTPTALNIGMPVDINAALNAANSSHPALQAAIANVYAADRLTAVQRAAYQPRFDLRLRTERGNNLGGIIGRRQDNSAEVVMNWNLFNGGSDRARVSQYAALINVARDQRDRACRDIRQTLEIAYNDTRKLAEQLSFLDQHQLATEKARGAYRKQFDIGQRTLLDVLDTENELFQARRAYVNAQYDLLTAYARTQAGVGMLFSALQLTHAATAEARPLLAGENAQACPTEAPQPYVANKTELNARAEQVVRDSLKLEPTRQIDSRRPIAAQPNRR